MANRKTRPVKPGELVPVADRIQWMLGWRAILSVAVLATWWLSDTPAAGGAGTWIGLALAWPAGTALSMLAPRAGRRVARAALTVSLLGDGVLLALAKWALGDQHHVLEFLIVLHAVAVTLLASFRTGVRLAVWHCFVAVLVIDAVMLELLPGTPTSTPWVFFGVLWAAVASTAGFAAMNERELRRRRHDSEQLRQFGLRTTTAPDAVTVAAALAEFAFEELPARKAVVLAHVQPPVAGEGGHTLGAYVELAGTTRLGALGPDSEPGPRSVIRHAMAAGPQLLRRLDPDADPWLAAMLPDAHNVVVLPFTIDKVTGALVVEVRRDRLERRLLETAMQATLHASVALDRIVLTEHIRATAETDGLTRVANRKRFDEAFAAALRHAGTSGADLALALVDIDHFKRLNDTYGHLTGDEVLKLVAAAIRAAIGESDLVARYGGEEFAVVMPGRDAASALATAERIRLSIAALETVTGVTASLGVATSPAHGSDAEALIASADAALYDSKHNGRNKVTFADAQPTGVLR
ncbi:GGDEF domain-containing protein [Paractinoplanes lichenicola]|uniref:GGDEF domain-containing protein n=1 Tax=Paractinoplanes lichenicola TaxID=2802976 RepID=A0ABS1W357_9ACTN|nr:GGDEF domain-containing protein [Actinoplanes lichenicola]MBL7261160.1 GGDEF domain-containing protein [Actinoplanes lichenicola]